MPSQLPPKIEIFRAGRHTDDSGTVHNFSAADVAGMVASYDAKLREAPLTVGHPEHNLPAYGWVKDLSINKAGNLVMNTHQVQAQFAEMVDAKLFKKRSAAFTHPATPTTPSLATGICAMLLFWARSHLRLRAWLIFLKTPMPEPSAFLKAKNSPPPPSQPIHFLTRRTSA